jgi:hypothetical protein
MVCGGGIYVSVKFRRNWSLYMQLNLHSLPVILIFTIFSCFSFKIHYRTKSVVCYKILKVTVHFTAAQSMQHISGIVK